MMKWIDLLAHRLSVPDPSHVGEEIDHRSRHIAPPHVLRCAVVLQTQKYHGINLKLVVSAQNLVGDHTERANFLGKFLPAGTCGGSCARPLHSWDRHRRRYRPPWPSCRRACTRTCARPSWWTCKFPFSAWLTIYPNHVPWSCRASRRIAPTK